MTALWRWWLLAVLAVSGHVAAQTCNQYRVSANGNLVIGASPGAACASAATKYATVLTTSSPAQTNTATLSGTAENSGTLCRMTGTNTTCNTGGACSTSPTSFSFSISVVPGPCDCSSKAGTPGATPGTAIFEYSGGSGAAPRFANQGCHGGCQIDLGSSIQGADRSPGGDWRVQVDVSQGTHTGNACVGSPEAPDTNTPPTYPSGTCPGTVNGVTVAVPCTESASKDTKTEVKNNPNGTTSVTNSTTTTTCNGAGACSTTTTTTGPGGTTTTTTTDTKSGHCADDPGSPLCGDGTGGDGLGDGEGEEEDPSTFGGSCGAFSCSGDAIFCAIAREQHQKNCQFFDDQSPEAQKGITAASAGLKPPDHPINSPEDVALPTGFDQTNLLGGGCPPDESVNIMGRSVSLPFSQLCGPAAMLGNLLVAMTALTCIGIVFVGRGGAV